MNKENALVWLNATFTVRDLFHQIAFAYSSPSPEYRAWAVKALKSYSELPKIKEEYQHEKDAQSLVLELIRSMPAGMG